MIRDNFLERLYFKKAKLCFREEIDVRVYRPEPNTPNYNLSISLKLNNGKTIYEYVIDCSGQIGFESLVESLKLYLNTPNTNETNPSILKEQFKAKALHLTGKVPDFNLEQLLSIANSNFL